MARIEVVRFLQLADGFVGFFQLDQGGAQQEADLERPRLLLRRLPEQVLGLPEIALGKGLHAALEQALLREQADSQREAEQQGSTSQGPFPP